MSDSVSVAVRTPCAVGVNATLSEHCWPKASEKAGNAQLPELTTNSEAFVPDTGAPVTPRAAPPIFLMTNEVLEVWPTVVGEMLSGKGNVAVGPAETVPVRFRTCGEFGAFVATLTVAVRVPVALAAGANTTLSEQKCEFRVQLLESTWNSELLAPETAGAPVLIGNRDVASLAGVPSEDDCESLVVPGPSPENVSVAGTNDAASIVPALPKTEIA